VNLTGLAQKRVEWRQPSVFEVMNFPVPLQTVRDTSEICWAVQC